MISLSNKTVLLTRAANQSSRWISKLEAVGARVINIPLIDIIPPRDEYRSLDQSIKDLNNYDCVAFTSQNAVRTFFGRREISAAGLIPRHLFFAAVGPATARCIRGQGVEKVMIADSPDTQGLLRSLARIGMEGKRVLFPRACDGRDELVDGLRDSGADVNLVEAYQTRCPPDVDRARLIDLVDSGCIDIALFASPSAVNNFVATVGKDRARSFAERSLMVPLGAITEEAMIELGLTIDKNCGNFVKDFLLQR